MNDDEPAPTDDDVLRVLTQGGCSVRDYVLCEGNFVLPYSFVPGPHGGVLALVIEDDRLARACVGFLRRRGAPQFVTHAEIVRYFETAGRSNSPK